MTFRNNDTRKKMILIILLSIAFGFGVGLALFSVRSEIYAFFWNKFTIAVPPEWIVENEHLSYAMGEHFFNQNGSGVYDLKKAQSYYRQSLKINPLYSNSLYPLARIDFLYGRFYSAIEKFNKILEGDVNKDADYSRMYYMRGLTYGYMWRFDEAEADFLYLMELNKDRPEWPMWAVVADLAWVYFQQGKFEDIEKITKEALVTNPNNPWLLTNYGLSLLNLEQEAESRITLEHALREAQKMTPEEWATAYPGNNPDDASVGLSNMIATLTSNLALTVNNIVDN